MDEVKEVKAKRTAKDSVFCNLFSDPKYQLQLFQALHPEETSYTEDDITTITLDNVLLDQQYNDLGLLVGNHFMILCEAQATWTTNIVIRCFLYLAQTLKDYVDTKKINLYSTKKHELPELEVYVIYTGDKAIEKEYISLTEEYYGGIMKSVEVRARVITDGKTGDIINQYVAFTKVFNEQVKLHGLTKKAIEETIRICKDENILKDYLESRREEVIDIMTQLYDKDKVLEYYVLEKSQEAAENSVLASIQKMMKNLKLTAEQAMNALEISPADQKKYMSML